MGMVLKIGLIQLIFVLVLKLTISSHGDCSNTYGRRCPYVPAPSGKTPPCARPGLTFCENPDGYPGELIMFLASQARYNHRSLVTDETKEDFSKATGPYPPAKYPPFQKEIDITTSAPNSYFQPQYQWKNNDFIEQPYVNNTNVFFGGGFGGGHQDAPVSQNGGQFFRYKYTSNIPQQRFRDVVGSHANFLWKRDGGLSLLHQRVKRGELFRRHLKEIRASPFKKNFTGEIKYRSKRQNGDFDSGNLCQSRITFITPRAALNKNGDWMYIVNMENSNQKYTQLVRSEVCVSQTCSSLCGLPNGYTSKCEQKYIQKRLVALQGQGDQLYTDVFWIPSCCICTIQRN